MKSRRARRPQRGKLRRVLGVIHNVLEALLAPVGVRAFGEQYWNRQPLHLSGGAARATELGVTLDSFLDTIRPPIGPTQVVVRAQYFTPEGTHQELVVPPASVPLARDLLDAGMTLCVANYHRLCAPVAEIARGLAAAIGVPGEVDVACYASGHGRGFGLHFDDTPIFVLQCEGAKRWRYSSAGMAGPARWRGNVRADDHREVAAFVRRLPGVQLEIPREQDLVECVLQPNDLLYLPAGTWHRTYAEDVSVALTFSLSSRRIDEAIAQAIGQHLNGPSGRTLALRETASPVDLTSWIRDRLPALLAHAGTLDPAVLAQSVGAAVAASCGSMRPGSPVAPAALDRSSLCDDTAFHVRDADTVAVFTAPDQDDTIRTYVYRGDDGLQLPRVCAPMLHAALAETRCTLGDLRRWLGAELDAASLLPSLVELGVLVPAP